MELYADGEGRAREQRALDEASKLRLPPLQKLPRLQRITSDNWEVLTDDDGAAGRIPSCIVKETSPFKERWDLVVMLCILYSAIMVPLRICFRSEAEGAIKAFEIAMSLLFCLDLAISIRRSCSMACGWTSAA